MSRLSTDAARRLPARMLAALVGLLVPLLALLGQAAAQPVPLRLKIVGGLGGVAQYTRHEAPFWLSRVPQLTAGVVQAEIAPFDRSGIRGQELLRLVRLGVVSYANVLLNLAAGDDPELEALALPLANRDQADLRRSAALLRAGLERLLRERYDAELLAIYIYPAQVTLCRGPFAGLADLAGRQVRVSSVAQADLMSSLGAVPVVIPFAEVVPAMRRGVVHCAITGAQSAAEIGLLTVATHVSAVPINWGVSVFVANRTAWRVLPETIRERLGAGLMQLQEEIWASADQANRDGMGCATGAAACPAAQRRHLQLVAEPPMEGFQRRLLTDAVVPAWLRRCGTACGAIWDGTMEPALNVQAGGR
jgi:TRAP-type C4-dicarboxylate transport system substrate-binding protein